MPGRTGCGRHLTMTDLDSPDGAARRLRRSERLVPWKRGGRQMAGFEQKRIRRELTITTSAAAIALLACATPALAQTQSQPAPAPAPAPSTQAPDAQTDQAADSNVITVTGSRI